MSRSRIFFAVGVVSLLVIGVLVWRPWTQPSPPPAKTLQPLRIGYLPIAAGLPLFVATEEGFFKDAGFDVQLTRFSSSNELASAGSAGRVDLLMPCALNVIFDIGAASGQHHLLFGVNEYSDQKPHIVDYLVARKDSGVRAVEDVRGKRIGAFPGSVTRVFVQSILRQHGIQPSDYTYLELAPQDWQPSLQSGSIDVASVMEPQASQILADGTAEVVVEGFFAKLMPDVPLSGHWLTEGFVKDSDPSRVAAAVAVYDRAVEYIRTNPENAKAYYLKYSSLRKELLPTMQLNKWELSTELSAANIQRFADILRTDGGTQAPIRVPDYIYVEKK